MSAGLRPAEFWELSLYELAKYITAIGKHTSAESEQSLKRLLLAAYKTANLTSVGVCDPKSFPKTADKAFPGVFSGGVSVRNWQESKDNMREYQRLTKGRWKNDC